jgi:hypothetical protein
MAAQHQSLSVEPLIVLAVVWGQSLHLLVVTGAQAAQQQMQILEFPEGKAPVVQVREMLVLVVPPSGRTISLAGTVKAQKEEAICREAAQPDLLVRQALCVSGNMHND